MALLVVKMSSLALKRGFCVCLLVASVFLITLCHFANRFRGHGVIYDIQNHFILLLDNLYSLLSALPRCYVTSN